MQTRTDLDVPKAHYEYAKRLGAKCDPNLGTLYILGEIPPGLASYAPKQQRTRDFAQEIVPSCPVCASRMDLRTVRDDLIWGCTRYSCRGRLTVDSAAVIHLQDRPSRRQAPPDRTPTAKQALRIQQALVLQHLLRHVHNEKSALAWLSSVKVGIQYRKPLELMDTEKGCQEVIEFIAKNLGNSQNPLYDTNGN